MRILIHVSEHQAYSLLGSMPYAHLDNLLLKKQPLYSLLPISILTPKHQHLAFIYNQPFLKVWLYPLHRNAEPHTVFGSRSPHLSAASHMRVRKSIQDGSSPRHPDWQTTTQKACSDSWKSTQKAEFQPAQLPKFAHSQHIVSLHHWELSESRAAPLAQHYSQQQNPLGPHELYLWMEPAPLQEALSA